MPEGPCEARQDLQGNTSTWFEGEIPVFANVGNELVHLTQELLRRHQTEVVRCRPDDYLALGEFPCEDIAVEVLKFQMGQRGSRARKVTEHQPERRHPLACSPEPSRENIKSRLCTERTDEIGGGALKHAHVALEFSQHLYQVLVNRKPLVEGSDGVAATFQVNNPRVGTLGFDIRQQARREAGFQAQIALQRQERIDL